MEGAKEGHQFADQNVDRPSVGGAVVQRQQQRPGRFPPAAAGVARSPRSRARSKGWSVSTRRETLASPSGSAHCRRSMTGSGNSAAGIAGECVAPARPHIRDQTRAQRFVPAHDLGQSETQGIIIELPDRSRTPGML